MKFKRARYGVRKRRFFRKRRTPYPYRRNIKSKLVRTIGPPPSMYTKLKYTAIRQVVIAGSSVDTQNWIANGLYDTDAAAGGGQPYYYDQYTAMYGRYRVYGAKFTWRVGITAGTSNLYCPVICMVPWVGSAPAVTIQTLMCKKGAIWKQVMPGQQIAYLTKYYSMAEMFGVSKKTISSDDQYAGTTGSNPPQNAVLQLVVQNYDGTAALTCSSELQVTFYIKFFGVTTPAAS